MQKGLRVVVATGIGYELLMSAVAVVDRDAQRRSELGRAWRRQAEALGHAEVLTPFSNVGREPFINLLGYVHTHTEDGSADALLRSLRNAEPRELVLTLAGYYRRAMRMVTPPEVMREAVDGSAAAQREFRRTSYPDLPHWQRTLRYLLSTPHRAVRDDLVRALRTWYKTALRPVEENILDVQRRDATTARELVVALDLDAVLERILPGMTFTRSIGQEELVLVPDVVVRPAPALSDYGTTFVIAYPATADRTDPTRPPERLMMLAKALSDPLRLRALRTLHQDGPMGVTDLAERLGVPRTSLHYHVRVLMEAGLMTLEVDDARWGRLVLRDTALADAGRLAEQYVLGPSAASGDRHSKPSL